MKVLFEGPTTRPSRKNLHSDELEARQQKVDQTYAALKDLAEERRTKLHERCDLFRMLREIDDLEQWIAEREVTASSQDIGQDFEHVIVSFSSKTLNGD